ncbi:MAG TPA: PAS domain-containing protein [Dongiaceae bacterium]|nr:PAS domain-containing protein [Dongiaceae bacterium]
MSDSQGGAEIEEIDPLVVERMADELATAGCSPTVDQLFTARDRPAPLVLWSPTLDQLPLDGLRFLLKFWNDARGPAAMPPVAAIDPLVLKPVLGNIIILDVLERGADFRFRLFGTQVAEAARYDWTGSTVDAMRRILKGPGPAFYLAGYRAVLRRREPLFTVSPAMVIFKSRSWARLVLPLGAGELVERILVGNYAIGDTFVSDADERKLADLREQMRAEREPR